MFTYFHTQVSITYHNYVISKRNNHYVLESTYVLHKLAIFNAVLLARPFALLHSELHLLLTLLDNC